MLRKILSIALLIFISMNVYAHKNLVVCKPSQLKLYFLANASYAMNSINLLYGIINHGKRACVIPNNLAIWVIESNGNEVKLKMWNQGRDAEPMNAASKVMKYENTSHKLIEIDPLQHTDYISSNKLVWFSTFLLFDGDPNRSFSKMLIKIPKILKKGSEVVSLTRNIIDDNGGIPHGLSLSTVNSITKGYLIRWKRSMVGDTCPAYLAGLSGSYNYLDISESHPNKPIKVYFKHTADCG